MKNRIYYFTGTGNSLRTAMKIAEKMGETELISMKVDPESVPATDCDTIGFVYPVYHWTVPEPVIRFVKKLKINRNAYFFAIANPSFICGFACERVAKLLRKKGANLNYGSFVNSVANYVIVYPPFPPAKLMVPLMEKKTDRIAEEVAQRIDRPYPKAGRMVRTRFRKFMGPYLEIQRYADQPFTVSDECIGCGLCSRVCPCNNIILTGGRPSFQHHCANCMACVTSCPKRAIGYEITKGDRELLNASGSKTGLVKIMGLPTKRKLYRNPYITVQDLTKEKFEL